MILIDVPLPDLLDFGGAGIKGIGFKRLVGFASLELELAVNGVLLVLVQGHHPKGAGVFRVHRRVTRGLGHVLGGGGNRRVPDGAPLAVVIAVKLEGRLVVIL